MKSLFIRVLALLLGSFLVVLVASFALFHWVNEELNPDTHKLHLLSQKTAHQLVRSISRGELHQVRHRLREKEHIRSWVMDRFDKPLTPDPVPPRIMRQIRGFPDVVYPFQNKVGRFFIFAETVELNEQHYKVVLTAPGRGLHRGARPGFFWLPILAVVLGLILASMLLSYWVLKPLRAFSRTARAFSGDSPGTRISPSITNRSDAFGELGRELNQMTERVEQSVSNQNQLLRDVSHELRSPLARIQVAASLWAQQLGGENHLERIDSEIGRMDNMINDLSALSRLKSGAAVDMASLDLTALLKQIGADAEFEFSATGIKLSLDMPQGVSVYGNQSLLSSAFENVVRNACRFSPVAGEVQISGQLLSGGIEISVSDKGPGVANADLENIFEPFFRADTARSPGNGQHGIGLALSRAVIELHGGEISATNGVDGGLVVRAVLKLP